MPLKDRSQSLTEIEQALKRIGGRIKALDAKTSIHESAPKSQDTINKLVVRTPQRAQIKIEVTPVLRGCVYEPRLLQICGKAEEDYGFAEMKVLSFEDIYAGKIMAALDRQHPRDLYDVHQLLLNEGISDELRTAVIVYLISHDHSAHQLLSTPCRDITDDYAHGFYGMTEDEISVETLMAAHADLVRALVKDMPDKHKRFLLSFYDREPQWELLGVEHVAELPAVRWREENLDKAGEETRAELVRELKELLSA